MVVQMGMPIGTVVATAAGPERDDAAGGRKTTVGVDCSRVSRDTCPEERQLSESAGDESSEPAQAEGAEEALLTSVKNNLALGSGRHNSAGRSGT